MADRICSLCGTHYNDQRGHSSSDCWGILHQKLLQAGRVVRDLEYKLERAAKRLRADQSHNKQEE